MNKERFPYSENERIQFEASKEHSEKIKHDIEKESRKAEKKPESHEEIRKKVESEAISGNEHRLSGGEKKRVRHNITKAEKTRTYKRTMNRVQSQLSTPSKNFSKFIHNPTIEKTSEAIGTTVARPSGLLGAGILGFIGFSIVLYFANKNGFEIPTGSGLIVILFIGGWGFGLLTEMLVRLIRK